MESAGSGKKNWFRMEPTGSGKKLAGSVRNWSEAVQGAGLNRSRLETGWTGRFNQFQFGSDNTGIGTCGRLEKPKEG
jgi:hypothetical protein